MNYLNYTCSRLISLAGKERERCLTAASSLRMHDAPKCCQITMDMFIRLFCEAIRKQG